MVKSSFLTMIPSVVLPRRIMAMRAPMETVASIRRDPIMSFSLDTPSAQTLKSEARTLREDRARTGLAMTHSEALEQVARATACNATC